VHQLTLIFNFVYNFQFDQHHL